MCANTLALSTWNVEWACANKFQEHVCKVKTDLSLGQRNEECSKKWMDSVSFFS